MHDVYATQYLHQRREADIVREAELRRRIAERSAAPAPALSSPPATPRLLTRWWTALAAHSHGHRPVLGG